MNRQSDEVLDIALDRLIDAAKAQLDAEGIEADYWCCDEPIMPFVYCERCELPVCDNCTIKRGLCENCYEHVNHRSMERWD